MLYIFISIINIITAVFIDLLNFYFDIFETAYLFKYLHLFTKLNYLNLFNLLLFYIM